MGKVIKRTKESEDHGTVRGADAVADFVRREHAEMLEKIYNPPDEKRKKKGKKVTEPEESEKAADTDDLEDDLEEELEDGDPEKDTEM